MYLDSPMSVAYEAATAAHFGGHPLGQSFLGTVESITDLPVENHACRIAARVPSIPIPPDWTAADFANLERLNQLVLWCCAAALRDAGHWDRRADLRVGMILGLGAKGLAAPPT